jgi:hypothetical protein
MWDALRGFPHFTMTALQGGTSVVELIPQLRASSAAAGTPWVVSLDEPQGIENRATDEDVGFPSGRKQLLWPALMAGAGGFEWYVEEQGGGHGLDQRIEDFRIMEPLLTWGGHALRFFEPLPLRQMEPHAELSDADGTLADPGRIYAVYVRERRTVHLDLSNVAGLLEVIWFSPTTGEWKRGATLTGGGASRARDTTVRRGCRGARDRNRQPRLQRRRRLRRRRCMQRPRTL